jgi:hypothetical protein
MGQHINIIKCHSFWDTLHSGSRLDIIFFFVLDINFNLSNDVFEEIIIFFQ